MVQEEFVLEFACCIRILVLFNLHTSPSSHLALVLCMREAGRVCGAVSGGVAV